MTKVEFVKKNDWVPVALAGTLSFVVGVGIGYFIGVKREKNRRKNSNSEQLSFDFDKVQYTFDSENTANPKEKTDESICTLDGFTKTSIADLVYVDDPKEPVPSEPPKIFRLNKPEDEVTNDKWDYDLEMPNRTSDQPYIIHVEEYINQEMENYSQSSLTYFAGDDILVDEQEVPIYDYRNVVGELRFGHGTNGDPNVVFVRNERLEMEWEILRDEGSYEIEVLGLQIEEDFSKGDLKHGVRRFRMD